jgi:hypothetical protein
MSVSFSDLQLAFEFVSSGGMGENEAYLDRQSGKIYWHSEFGDQRRGIARRYRQREIHCNPGQESSISASLWYWISLVQGASLIPRNLSVGAAFCPCRQHRSSRLPNRSCRRGAVFWRSGIEHRARQTSDSLARDDPALIVVL